MNFSKPGKFSFLLPRAKDKRAGSPGLAEINQIRVSSPPEKLEHAVVGLAGPQAGVTEGEVQTEFTHPHCRGNES